MLDQPLPQRNRPFRFGVVSGAAGSAEDWLARARRVEALGYDTLVVPDNLAHLFAPFLALTAAAVATTRLRLGTYVLANDFRSPVLVAKDTATLDALSGGRCELGLGAGRPASAAENAMLGLPFDSGGVRVARLGQALDIITALLAGERVSVDGPYYHLEDATVGPRPPQQPHPPLLVAGSGRRMLALAARKADIVALGVGPQGTEDAVADMIDWLRAAAPERFAHLELNLNLMAVGGQLPSYLARMGMNAEQLARSGSVAAISGTLDEMCAQLERRRETLGISYLVVGDELMESFAPVAARLAGR
ncbi:MAG TPA: TIGR03621 family F420-dependent LLM class oxidoreductase [Thermomicrobiaceae bacterium]|nr:TIGR03621 family F420-dependent LLM class oxidoreductase [Thermomicrobiaceae bacterium]